MRLLILPVLLFAATAHAECPSSTIRYGGVDPTSVIAKVAPACDTLLSPQGCDRLHSRYQVSAGLLIASVDVACPEAFGTAPSGIGTVVEDAFTFVGPAPGTLVNAQVEFHFSGEVHAFGMPGGGSGGRVTARLEVPLSPIVSLQRSTSPSTPDVTVQSQLSAPVSALVGDPVTLRFTVIAEAYEARARLDGEWRFVNLPPGVSVQSCRGYSSALPVSARRSSWGAVKAFYR